MQDERVWQETAERVERACAERGFDLVRPFAAAWFNDAVPEERRLPDFGRSPCLALVIGNTRALWPRFVAALREDPAVRVDPHPIHRYTEAAIGGVLDAIGVDSEVRWAHGPPPFVPIQRIAEIAGLAYLAPGRVCVHPRFGPWIGLRAVVVLDLDGPSGEPPRMKNPCDACERACAPALERAQAGAVSLETIGAASLETTGAASLATPGGGWRLWLAVRDACPLGAQHRYDEEQIEYHYTKDVEVLRKRIFGRGAP